MANRSRRLPVKKGRPSTYSAKSASQICDRLAEGSSLRSICRDTDMPSCSTVFQWLSKNPKFSEQYARAREAQADAIADECLDIAKHEPDVQRARLMIDVRKWFASKMKPRKYGDQLEPEEVVDVQNRPEAWSIEELARRTAFALAVGAKLMEEREEREESELQRLSAELTTTPGK